MGHQGIKKKILHPIKGKNITLTMAISNRGVEGFMLNEGGSTS